MIEELVPRLAGRARSPPRGRPGRAEADRAPGGDRHDARESSATTTAGRAAAVAVLRAGGVVALPTDTVYGIGVALDTPGGIERLFDVKRRPPDKGIMLLLDDAGAGGRARGR